MRIEAVILRSMLVMGVLGGPLWAQGAASAAPEAHASAPPAIVDPHALGVRESLLHYCTRVDAKVAIRIQGQLEEVLRGESHQALMKLRATAAYRAGYDAMTKFTGQIDPHNAVKPCLEAMHVPLQRLRPASRTGG